MSLCNLLLFIYVSELGEQSTISSVLYANQNHPELKIEFPHWPDRYKQVLKKWRALSTEKKAPYLQRARDNRSAQQAQIRTKKVQQVCFKLVIRIQLFISSVLLLLFNCVTHLTHKATIISPSFVCFFFISPFDDI